MINNILHSFTLCLRDDKKTPVVDIGQCTLCGGCIEVCPMVFRLNDIGFIEVSELEQYPEADVDEAIKNCPEDCIYWEEE